MMGRGRSFTAEGPGVMMALQEKAMNMERLLGGMALLVAVLI